MSTEVNNTPCFTPFKKSVKGVSLPEKFTFPFYYEPHELATQASTELQEYLENGIDWDHNFGLKEGKSGLVIGKMFGVLVVQNEKGELGYISAFSGKVADENHHPGFVPPVYDILETEGFFMEGIVHIKEINQEIIRLENSEEFSSLKDQLEAILNESEKELGKAKQDYKSGKKERKAKREAEKPNLSDSEFESLQEELKQESLNSHFYVKNLTRHYRKVVSEAQEKHDAFLAKITELKRSRKAKSGGLQQQIFENFQFLNSIGEDKNLLDIFTNTIHETPPAGAGECCAPKLMQYAYLNNLKPIALAEFWWGQSPKSEIRKHLNYYPACKGKCEPILSHMLIGLDMDENPLLLNPGEGKELPIIYEDDEIVIVNKPAEFLSVPGKTVTDSVQERIKTLFPTATGPLLVHRLDMSTSGILLVAKTKEAHKNLQLQFIKRSVKKRYVALLDGELSEEEGVIDLPLRVDLEDRPRQLVCHEHGKSAQTKWEKIKSQDGKTRVYFYPYTGRTHQLRVHAAHNLGLGSPIVGDDLYGQKTNRLHLHAQKIEFRHPMTKEEISFEVNPDF